jgi:hypothetical protein
MYQGDFDCLRVVTEPERALVEAWWPKAFNRCAGDGYGFVRNADEVVVEPVVAIDILINAAGICPRRQIDFNAQLLRPVGNVEKAATDRLRAVARESTA